MSVKFFYCISVCLSTAILNYKAVQTSKTIPKRSFKISKALLFKADTSFRPPYKSETDKDLVAFMNVS